MGINSVSCVTAVAKVFSGVSKCTAKTDKTSAINLYRFLKKGLHNFDELAGILKKLPEEEKFIGSLPDNWRKLFNPAQISGKTRKIQKILSDFAQKFQETNGHPDLTAQAMNKLEKDLCKTLGEKVEVDFTGLGMFGSVVRINGAKEDLALKVFHKTNYPITPHSPYKSHGQTMELQNIAALNHALKPSQRARFYCGKATVAGEKDGFILSEFVKAPAAQVYEEMKPFEELAYRKFACGDNLTYGNIINGKIVDFGNISRTFKNKQQELFAKKLFPLIIKGDKDGISKLIIQNRGNTDFAAVVEYCRNVVNSDWNNFCNPVSRISKTTDKTKSIIIASANALGVNLQ